MPIRWGLGDIGARLSAACWIDTRSSDSAGSQRNIVGVVAPISHSHTLKASLFSLQSIIHSCYHEPAIASDEVTSDCHGRMYGRCARPGQQWFQIRGEGKAREHRFKRGRIARHLSRRSLGEPRSMKTLNSNNLFTPVQVGSMQLEHRVVMAPLTRSRSVQPRAIPGDLMLEYYTQRASEGGLIVSEATPISIAGGGWFGAPGLYSDEQVAGWRRITNAVHAKRGYMFSQLWHTGRASHVDTTKGITAVSSSVNPEYWQDPTILESTPHGWQQPSPHRALDIREIPEIVEDYRKAAERAKAAGFDGVELHALRIIAKPPSAQKPQVLMALSSTRVTATCPINFSRMASTSELICMAVRSRIAPASCFKW